MKLLEIKRLYYCLPKAKYISPWGWRQWRFSTVVSLRPLSSIPVLSPAPVIGLRVGPASGRYLKKETKLGKVFCKMAVNINDGAPENPSPALENASFRRQSTAREDGKEYVDPI